MGAASVKALLADRGFVGDPTQADRLSTLNALLALASAWIYRAGETLATHKPTPQKTLDRPLESIFRHGLDFICPLVLNPFDRVDDFLWLISLLSRTESGI